MLQIDTDVGPELAVPVEWYTVEICAALGSAGKKYSPPRSPHQNLQNL
jgi:hypothetical protein